jgi:trimeric autotransporter adhesin
MNEIETNLNEPKQLTNNNDQITSTMATPMLYISRSSSMTSLNSFDIKSVHSSIASEYSQVTSPSTNLNTKKKFNNGLEETEQEEEEGNSYLVDDDLDLIMPESPSAQHESSFLMTQRVKHKQQQIVYRQTAAAAMLPSSSTTTTTQIIVEASVNNNNNQLMPKFCLNDPSYIQQMNKFISSNNNNTKTVINNDLNTKPWKQCVLNQTDQSLNANNNMKLTDLNVIMSRLNINNTVTTTSTVKSSTNNNNIHTPPVKLVQTPKFISNNNFQQFNTIPLTVSNNTSISSNQPPMSVTYAFMKKANINPIIPSNINTTTTNSTTQTNVNFNNGTYQPKFLLTNNHQSYPTFNLPISSSSSSNSSQASVIQQQQQQQQQQHEIVESPCIYSMESYKKSNPSSPQESVCSRMSDSSVPSLIRQDILSSQVKNDFKALFSRLKSAPLNNSNMRANVTNYEQQLHQEEDEDKPKVFQNYEEEEFNKTPKVTQYAERTSLFATNFVVPTTTAPFNNPQHPQNYLFQHHQILNESNNLLDTTYSPKIFQNEGTNSRYSSASSLNENELDQIENNDIESSQEDQEDDLLENFIKEMLPAPILSSSSNDSTKKLIQTSESSLSLSSSVSSTLSRQNNTNINDTKQTKTANKNQLSNSNSFKENNNKTTKTLLQSNTIKKTANKRLSAEIHTNIGINKPKTVIVNKVSSVQPANKPIKSLNSNGPVVNMTKTAQLRAFNNKKLANATTLATANIASKQSASTKAIINNNLATTSKQTKLKENLTLKQSQESSNDLNNSTNIINNNNNFERSSIRRQSFSFGCNKTNSLITTSQSTKPANKTDASSNSSRIISKTTRINK